MNGPTCLRILCRKNDSENVVKSSSSSCNQFVKFVTPGFQITLQGTNISPQKWHFEDDFYFPKVGYVSSLEGIRVVFFSVAHLM